MKIVQVKKKYNLLINDRRLGVREITEIVGISTSAEYVNNPIRYEKAFARWMLLLFTINNKHTRVLSTKEYLAMPTRNWKITSYRRTKKNPKSGFSEANMCQRRLR